jgi:hypothetical protein
MGRQATSAAGLAAADAEESLAVDRPDIEAHIVKAIEGDDAFNAEGLGEMLLEHRGLTPAEI